MGRNIELGLKEAWWANLLTDDEDGVSYAEPRRFLGVQQVQISPNVNSVDVPGDDGIVTTLTDVQTVKVTLKHAHLSSEESALLLGKKKLANGIIVSGQEDCAPYGAYGYKRTMKNAVTGKEVIRYVWLLKIRFSEASETNDTKAPNQMSPQYPQLDGVSVHRLADGRWKYQVDSDSDSFTKELGEKWFTRETLEILYADDTEDGTDE